VTVPSTTDNDRCIELSIIELYRVDNVKIYREWGGRSRAAASHRCEPAAGLAADKRVMPSRPTGAGKVIAIPPTA
jgi:hypothetical protein